MDRLIQKEQLQEAFRKYRYLVRAVLLGILFMGIPQKEQSPPEEPVTIRPPDLEAELATRQTELDAGLAAAGVSLELLDLAVGEAETALLVATESVEAIDLVLQSQEMDRQKLADTVAELAAQVAQLVKERIQQALDSAFTKQII